MTERRLDLAREIGEMSVQIRALNDSVKTLTGKLEHFTALENRMHGAIWAGRIAIATAVAFIGYGIWVFGKLKALM